MLLPDLIRSRRNFFIGYLVFFTTTSFFLFFFEKHEGHLLINSCHSPLWDNFFKNITHLGDGIAVGVLGLIFLLLQIRKGLIVWLAGGLSGMITQFFKRSVFTSHYRPIKYFEQNYPDIELPLVSGIEMHSNFSFPSGHTTAAFAMMTAVALLSKSKIADVVFILAAIVISFSRVYISQHFLEDVLAGSFVGTIVSVLVFSLFNTDKMKNIDWMDKKILPSKNRKNDTSIK